MPASVFHLWLTLMSCCLRWPSSSFVTQPITFLGSLWVDFSTASKYSTNPSSFYNTKHTQKKISTHFYYHIKIKSAKESPAAIWAASRLQNPSCVLIVIKRIRMQKAELVRELTLPSLTNSPPEWSCAQAGRRTSAPACLFWRWVALAALLLSSAPQLPGSRQHQRAVMSYPHKQSEEAGWALA